VLVREGDKTGGEGKSSTGGWQEKRRGRSQAYARGDKRNLMLIEKILEASRRGGLGTNWGR